MKKDSNSEKAQNEITRKEPLYTSDWIQIENVIFMLQIAWY